MSKTSLVLGLVAGGFIMHWAMTGDTRGLQIGLLVAAIGMVVTLLRKEGVR